MHRPHFAAALCGALCLALSACAMPIDTADEAQQVVDDLQTVGNTYGQLAQLQPVGQPLQQECLTAGQSTVVFHQVDIDKQSGDQDLRWTIDFEACQHGPRLLDGTLHFRNAIAGSAKQGWHLVRWLKIEQLHYSYMHEALLDGELLFEADTGNLLKPGARTFVLEGELTADGQTFDLGGRESSVE